MPKSNGLTPKQAMFVREWLIDRNSTQAAIRAGYSEDSAGAIGSENLKKPEIQAAVAREESLRAERLEVTADRIAVELKRIAFADLRDVIGIEEFEYQRQVKDESGEVTHVTETGTRVVARPTDSLTEEQAAALSEIAETKDGLRVKMHSKVAALDQLGKILGMHRETLDVNSTGPPPVFNIAPASPGEGKSE